jgi:DNA-binding transcriptional regulator YiaG
MDPTRRRRRRRPTYRAACDWDADGVRALRRFLGLTQEDLSTRLGIRQQTISEWEVGKHRPRGASRTLLNVIAEQAGFAYRVAPSAHAPEDDRTGGTA